MSAREGLENTRAAVVNKLRLLGELSPDTPVGKNRKTVVEKELQGRVEEIDQLLYNLHAEEEVAKIDGILNGDQPEPQ